MSIHGYVGNVITANPTAPTSSVATGVWTTEQQLIAVAAGNWPMALTQISRSLRFNSADSAYLNRTPASAGNRKTWTWSGWVKRGTLGSAQVLLSSDVGTSNTTWLEFGFDAADTFTITAYTTDSNTTSAVFRDPSAWYHIVVAFDTTQATAANRCKIYVNGTQQTLTGSGFTLNADYGINNNQIHDIGRRNWASGVGRYLDGYLTEINFIDGQALTPSSFGFNSSDTGVWSPKQYTGPFGTNGFYVNFSDNSNTTAATLGKDYSGNGNNWTPNNFSVTAGAGNDSMVDSPTPYGTDTGVGGEVRGNYATANPLDAGSGFTFTNGNLDYTNTTDNRHFRCTFAMPSSGKFYWEVTITASPINHGIALIRMNSSLTQGAFASNDFRGYANAGTKYSGAGSVAYGNSFTTNDVIGVAVDMDSGKIWFSKNGAFQASGDPAAGTNAAFTDIVSSGFIWMPGINTFSATPNSGVLNFGQRAFAYTAPSGFKALVTTNLPTPTIGATSTTQANDYFNAVTYTGNGTSLSVTGVGFQPDLIWIKDRSNARAHVLQNAIAGFSQYLQSNATDAETTASSGVTAVGSDGFTVGTQLAWNSNTETYVAWNWNAGGSNATNTSGTITSTVRANTTSGFSIATYTGNGSGGATVGHGLGVSPAMIFIKSRSNSTNWMVWHQNLTANYAFEGLNTTGAEVNGGSPSKYVRSVSSTLVTIGNDISVNQSASYTYVMYCFAPVAGYSAFGSYAGNGSTDGPFVYTGFRPRYLLVKSAGTAGTSWGIYDSSRNLYNVTNAALYTDLANAESTSYDIDFLSNGFKIRATTTNLNGNGVTLIFAAFAEFPFKFSLAR